MKNKEDLWPNGCYHTAPSALRYLADHDRPDGGEQDYNSEHLYQIADELETAFKCTQNKDNHISHNKLIDMGFEKIEGSINPTYYTHKSFTGYRIGLNREDKWGLYYDVPICGSLVNELSNMPQLILCLISTSIVIGKRIRSNEIKQLIG